VVADMAATPESLIESELFGHVRGAFTGASADRKGVFAQANGGTLFIDELGELKTELQPRLLRAIEQHRFKPVGADTYQLSDLRLVAATNRSLEDEVKEGTFRADLFYRLAVVRIRMPPLRERKDDVAHLVKVWLQDKQVEVAPAAFAVLEEHDWPGNVRELKNTLERALARLDPTKRVIEPQMLGLDTLATSAQVPWPKVGEADFVAARDRMVAAWERHYLEQLLKRTGGNVARAAREGGLDRAYLHKLLRRHQIGSQRPRP
jgi:transcriptional regulator with GAF, ATPase, and Fis domain